jgi:hypothetical protein
MRFPEGFDGVELTMSKKSELIAEASAELESAIQEREPTLWPIFLKYRDKYLHDPRVRDPGQEDEAQAVRRYLMIASLYAACFQLKGDRVNRDNIIQACTLLPTTVDLDLDPIDMLGEFHRVEDYWTGLIRKEGLLPNRGCGVVACVAFLAVAAGLALACV